jgi:hypothetical protein
MRNWNTFLIVLLLFLFELHTVQASPIRSIPLQAYSNSTLIYYRLDPNGSDTCTDHGPITLGDFIKKTLPNEWIEGWANTPGGIEALKAGAIAIRTYAISSYNAEIITVGSQSYYCTKAWRQQGFDPNEVINNFPNSVAAVNATDNIIMIHPTASTREINIGWPVGLRTGSIDAQYRNETGTFTSDGPYPWLKQIYDVISSGSPQQGMGQYGSKRWAWGANDSGQAYPKWDYRRILAHYYSEIDFVGISPDPPNDYRINIMETQGVPPNGGLIMCRGEELTGVVIHSQNVANALAVDNASLPGFCSGITNPQTLIGYHLYRQDGTVACTNCVGLRSAALCHPGGLLPPGRNQFSTSFRIFIPNDPAIIKGNTYLVRFDLKRNGVWQGRNSNFPWPPQDVPVTICTGGGGSGSPEVSVDRPPAVVSYTDLVNGRYGFSWSGRNTTSYDLQYRSKQIGEAAYPSSFVTLLDNSSAQQFSASINCAQDRRDWQFRLRGRNNTQTGNWTYVDSQTRAYPHPWLSYWSIGGVVLNSDPGPWPRPLDVINLGGGTFNWSASKNQNWITLANSSGQGVGSVGVVINKPGGNGNYSGAITVNITGWSPSPNCNATTTFNVPVTLGIYETLNSYYLPIIFKNSQ